MCSGDIHSSHSKPSGGEGAPALIDGNASTKWGNGHTNGTNSDYLIFKTSKAINPSTYTLTVANDTPSSTGRQWVTWRIYGANFVLDRDATKDAAEWVLIDEKKGITNDDFPTGTSNNTYLETQFDISETILSNVYYHQD